MKRLRLIPFLMLILHLSSSPLDAQVPLTEFFENWANPFVVAGWKTRSVGGWGGEYSQIYGGAQGIAVQFGAPDGYGSIYRDLKVTAGKHYVLVFSYTSVDSGSKPRAWIQFYDVNGNVLKTHGTNEPLTEFSPNGQRGYVETDLPPSGTDHARVIFQVLGNTTPRGTSFMDVKLYEGTSRIPDWRRIDIGLFLEGVIQEYALIEGPFLVRNTEWKSPTEPPIGWAFHSTSPNARYYFQPTAGSGQGISVGGTANDYKSVYRDIGVIPGIRYVASAYAISNSTNERGEVDPSVVRFWVQYADTSGRILSTHGISGAQAGIKTNEWKEMLIRGPGGGKPLLQHHKIPTMLT